MNTPTTPPTYYEKKWIEYFEEQPFKLFDRLEKTADFVLNLHIAFLPLYFTLLTLLERTQWFCFAPVLPNIAAILVHLFFLMPKIDVQKTTELAAVTDGAVRYLRQRKIRMILSLFFYLITLVLTFVVLLLPVP